MDELNKKLHKEGNEKILFNIEKSRSPITIEQVENLLKYIKDCKTVKQHDTSKTAHMNSKVELWPFLQEIPVAEQSDICNKLINELRSRL